MTTENARRLVLLRHARAESDGDDVSRTLTDAGREAARAAGRKLASLDIAPDLALCSEAARARETWKEAAGELPSRGKTRYEDVLYEASLGDLISLINTVSDDVSDLAVIGHNPGIAALAEALAGDGGDDLLHRMNHSGFPSAAIAVITFNDSWKAVEQGSGELTQFWTPGA
ncbi:SixA phosphatase family protein [Streptomyces sp. NPDC088788]|uniref:SixA phosphatase family protein n=1 Tax=Streptomyces sp. NPDC088788 TaxID=3365898 RepID=UPI0037F198F2